MKSVGKLENEDFKQIRDELEDYFERTPDLPEIYDELDTLCNAPLRAPFKAMKDAAERLLSLMETAGSDATKDKFRDVSASSTLLLSSRYSFLFLSVTDKRPR